MGKELALGEADHRFVALKEREVIHQPDTNRGRDDDRPSPAPIAG